MNIPCVSAGPAGWGREPEGGFYQQQQSLQNRQRLPVGVGHLLHRDQSGSLQKGGVHRHGARQAEWAAAATESCVWRQATHRLWFVCWTERSTDFTITGEDYLQDRGSLSNLRFTVTGKSGDQSVSNMKVVVLKVPKLTVTVKHADVYIECVHVKWWG